MRYEFVSYTMYMNNPAYYEKEMRKGNIWIERMRNYYFCRFYWLQGRTIYTEAAFKATPGMPKDQLTKIIEETVNDEQQEFHKLYKLSFIKPSIGL